MGVIRKFTEGRDAARARGRNALVNEDMLDDGGKRRLGDKIPYVVEELDEEEKEKEEKRREEGKEIKEMEKGSTVDQMTMI